MDSLRAHIAQGRGVALAFWKRIEDPRWQTACRRPGPGAPELEFGVLGDCFMHGLLVQAVAGRDRVTEQAHAATRPDGCR